VPSVVHCNHFQVALVWLSLVLTANAAAGNVVVRPERVDVVLQ